jgi:3-phenylpropionate/trans-cinnamate dioxygenase ferredoxin reductase subunit
MLGKGGPYDEVPWFWSDQYEHELQYAGFHEGWDDVSVQGDPGEGSFSAYYFTKGALQAAVAIDRAADIRHAIQSISAGRS